MTSTASDLPTLRVSGPGELLQAVPYLLGFHARDSVVLVGLDRGRVVVTARLDLGDAERAGRLEHTVAALCAGGAAELVGIIYGPPPEEAGLAAVHPYLDLADLVHDAVCSVGAVLGDVLVVAGGRWWSLTCDVPQCCPPEGRELDLEASEVAAAATYAGLVALPDRAALEAVLVPPPDADRDTLLPALGTAEERATAAILEGRRDRERRSAKRAFFAAARHRAARSPSGGSPGPVAPDARRSDAGLSDADAVRFAVALRDIAVRDAVWMAIDGDRLDARELCLELALTLPSPYDAAPLFLYGWAAWRAGNGALAGIAAERAVASDPTYSAADLLLAALSRGLDPRAFPRLRGQATRTNT